MQTVTWKILRGLSHCQPDNNTDSIAIYHQPFEIAKDLLMFIAGLPEAAIEAHRPAIEFKIFEIVSSVIDSMTPTTSRSTLDLTTNNNGNSSFQVIHPGLRHVLLGL